MHELSLTLKGNDKECVEFAIQYARLLKQPIKLEPTEDIGKVALKRVREIANIRWSIDAQVSKTLKEVAELEKRIQHINDDKAQKGISKERSHSLGCGAL